MSKDFINISDYVSNADSNIFVLKNLPEVVKAALFSKYSRSSLGLKYILLTLISDQAYNPSSHLPTVVDSTEAGLFYKRVLDGYGDDSIAEMGGAHLALENISILAAKEIQDSRIGGSFIEKSTRYVKLNKDAKGMYPFYRQPNLQKSVKYHEYVSLCDILFDNYHTAYKSVYAHLVKINSVSNKKGHDSATWDRSLRARTFDAVRGLLPLSTLTNMGIYGNGRFYTNMLNKAHSSKNKEVVDIAQQSFKELNTVIGPLISKADPNSRHASAQYKYNDYIQCHTKAMLDSVPTFNDTKTKVKLLTCDPIDVNLLSAFMQTQNDRTAVQGFITEIGSARENRRHKIPRFLESVNLTFDITSDYATYRDLQRHRMMTQMHGSLNCLAGYYTDPDIIKAGVLDLYKESMDQASAFQAKLKEPFEYAIPMGFNLRWITNINLRELVWLVELRSTPQGHQAYREIAQGMYYALLKDKNLNAFKSLFSCVDLTSTKTSSLIKEKQGQRN